MNFIQLRSDTRTVPTQQIRSAINSSLYGDWTYNEDQSVKELEEYTAKLFGKEDAAYVISGVFGNQISILTASSPGQQLLVRDKGHVIKYENGSVALISRLMTRTLDCPQGYITPQLLRKIIKKKKDSQSPQAGVLVLEFPTFEGLVPPIDKFNECCKIAKEQGIHVHVDGARVFNGLAQLTISPAELVKNVSSLTFCLSKGLCSPLGSLVVGDKDFIRKLKINRKMLGGVLRKPGVVAGPGLVAIKTMPQTLAKDNQTARELSKKMTELGWIEIVIPVETNIIFFKFTVQGISASALQKYMDEKGNIKCELADNVVNRFVCHHYIREKQVECIINTLREFKQSNLPN